MPRTKTAPRLVPIIVRSFAGKSFNESKMTPTLKPGDARREPYHKRRYGESKSYYSAETGKASSRRKRWVWLVMLTWCGEGVATTGKLHSPCRLLTTGKVSRRRCSAANPAAHCRGEAGIGAEASVIGGNLGIAKEDSPAAMGNGTLPRIKRHLETTEEDTATAKKIAVVGGDDKHNTKGQRPGSR